MTYALIRNPASSALSWWSAGDGGLNWQMREERREIFERRAGRAVSVLNCYHCPSRCCGNWLPASPLISSVFTVTLVRWGEGRWGEATMVPVVCSVCGRLVALCSAQSCLTGATGWTWWEPGNARHGNTVSYYTLHYSTTDNTSTTY